MKVKRKPRKKTVHVCCIDSSTEVLRRKMQKATKRIAATKRSSLEFLMKTGIVTPSGQVARVYRS